MVGARLRARLRSWCASPDSSVSPITSGKRLNGGSEIGLGEVRPQDVGEVELGVGRLPQQEVTQSLFSAGADEQIHVTRTARCVDGLTQDRSKAWRVGDVPLATRPAAANSASRAE